MLTIVEIIKNKDNTYPGDLKDYFKVIWYSPNVNNYYHNLRHMLHVMWATYQGAMYYGDKISPLTLRNMLIAALFHDYNHSGNTKDDGSNIEIAIKGLKCHIDPIDAPYFDEISSYIKGTQFPPVVMDLNLPASIVRDADVAYTLADVWIQTVNFGLNVEIGISTKKMLKLQEPFLRALKFMTEWAEKEYGSKIEGRIEEANEMYSIIYGND